MKNRLYRFMYGRYGQYGQDALNTCLWWVWLAGAVVNLFLRSTVLNAIVLVLCVVIFFRLLSRNISARQKENMAFLRIAGKLRPVTDEGKKIFSSVRRWWNNVRLRFSQRKTHCFFKCPACGAPLRVPRRKGRMQIRCVKCGHQFEKKIR